MKVFRNNGGFLVEAKEREISRTLSVSVEGLKAFHNYSYSQPIARFNPNYFLIIYF